MGPAYHAACRPRNLSRMAAIWTLRENGIPTRRSRGSISRPASNPVPFPIPELPAEIWSRLPTRAEEEALLAAAAARYRVPDPGMIAAASGSQALIQLLPRLAPTSRVQILGPTYEEHEACWTRQGHRVSVVNDLTASDGADVVIVVNPNNPTGCLIPASELRTVATALAGKNGLLVVDEAFIDVLPEAASLASDPPPATSS